MTTLLLAVGIFSTILSPAAEAHYIYAGNILVAQEGDFCLLGYSEISHGSNNLGYSKIGSSSYAGSPTSVPCFFRTPAWIYQHALTVVIYWWNGGTQVWDPCFGTQWFVFNSTSARQMSWNINLACGAGAYTTQAYIYGRNQTDGDWHGNLVLSGSATEYYHWLPA